MPEAPPLAGVLLGQIRYQATLLARNPRALYTGFAFPVLLLLVRHAASGHGVAALVGGVVTFGIVGTAYVTHASGLVAARDRGTLKRLHGAPLPPWCYFAGRITATVGLAAIGAAVTVAIAAGTAGVHLSAAAVVSLALAVLACAVCWAAVGSAMAAFIPNAEAALPMLMLTYLPVMFASGALFTYSGEPAWLADVASWLPASPASDAIGGALSATAVRFPVRDVLLLAGWAALGLVVAVARFRFEPPPPKAGRRIGHTGSHELATKPTTQ